MVGGYDDVLRLQHVQGVAVEEHLASVVDEVGGSRQLAVAHQVALAVVARAVGVLPPLHIAAGQHDAVATGVKGQGLPGILARVAYGQVVERHVVGRHVDGGVLVHVAAILVIHLVPGDDGVLLRLARQVHVGAVDLHMSLVGTGFYKYIIRCSIGGGCVDGLLYGGKTALAHRGVEAVHPGDALVAGVLLGVNRAVGHAVEVLLQVRISALGQPHAVAAVGGV